MKTIRSVKAKTFLYSLMIIFFLKLLQTKGRKLLILLNDPAYITDTVSYFTVTFTKFMEKNMIYIDWFLSLDSLFIDITITIALVLWAIRPMNTFILSMGVFYGVRSICFTFTQFPLLQPYIFFFSYPSIMVPDAATNDLFFSGHTGCMIILTLDSFHHKRNFLGYFNLFILLFTLPCLVYSEGHYTNDILFGFIVSYFAFKMALAYGNILAMICLKVYLFLIKKIYTKKTFRYSSETLLGDDLAKLSLD